LLFCSKNGWIATINHCVLAAVASCKLSTRKKALIDNPKKYVFKTINPQIKEFLTTRKSCSQIVSRGNGGETGIRTPEGLSPQHAFQACALNRSATSPISGHVIRQTRLSKLVHKAELEAFVDLLQK
jgi:hypothetical protein